MVNDRTRPLGSPASSAPRELREGEQVGPWRVRRALARGGFGTVYEAQRGDQVAALKLLHAHLVTSQEVLARFDREIRIIERLAHPNIVRLVDAGFSGAGRPYLCMELCEGEDLARLIEREGALAPARALEVFEPLCDALAAAHELGVIHRDVKASNVLVARTAAGAIGRVVLLDFGIAKLADALAPELTATNQSLGTPACMAPEQIDGRRSDARTDVYALGGLLFHMVTGRVAFLDPSATMTQYLHLHARRPRASSLASVSRRLDEVIVRAMAIEPAERFGDVRSALAAARIGMRETAVSRAVRVGETPAILVAVTDRHAGSSLDEALLEDLEAVLPAAERFLGGHALVLAVDLGSSALFVDPGSAKLDPVAIAIALWEHLEQRPRRDPRVQLGIAVHRDEASFAGVELQPGPLLRPATWGIPEGLEGVWVSGAFDPATPTGVRVR